jgi:predicted AAA+ superfamily ATPase
MKDGIVLRERYLGRIREFIGDGDAKVFIGIRRGGKSTLMRLTADEIREKDPECNMVYVNMELLPSQNMKSDMDLYTHVKNGLASGVKNYVFVDEIQEIHGWENAIRSLVAEKCCDIYLTGSNSSLLSSEYSTRMTGRYVSIWVRPLSFAECMEFRTLSASDADVVFDRFLRVGGFPKIWAHETGDEGAYTRIRDIYSNIVLNDLMRRHDVRNADVLRHIMMFICDNIGKITSLNNIYNYLHNNVGGVGKETVYSYVGYLEEAFLIQRCRIYDLRGKRILEPRYKFYLTDLGIKHALLGYRKDDIGKHLENIVFLELLGRGYEICTGETDGREVDFVAVKREKKLYIQCAYLLSEEAVEREFGNLRKIRDDSRKIVVTMDRFWGTGNLDGIDHMYVTDFLTSDF